MAQETRQSEKFENSPQCRLLPASQKNNQCEAILAAAAEIYYKKAFNELTLLVNSKKKKKKKKKNSKTTYKMLPQLLVIFSNTVW